MNDSWDIQTRTLRCSVFLIWLLCAAVMIYIVRHPIGVTFFDPDDALRLVEVRDWMAGQSWFDVTQYRSHPPAGASMHWSRLVDIPIAGLLALALLVTDQVAAEQISLVAVPLLSLLVLYIGLVATTVRATGRRYAGVIAALMLMTALGALIQFRPTRIDHHGWQIALGTLAVLALIGFDGKPIKRGVVSGATMAVALVIAIEGLPLAVAIGAVFGLCALRREDENSGLAAYLAALSGIGSVLLLATLGWSRVSVLWCDALSPAYLAPLWTTTIVLVLAQWISPQGSIAWRFGAMVVAAASGSAVYLTFSRACLGGPFASLDPLLYRLWYVNIAEGMPVWTQSLSLGVTVSIPSLLGLGGTLLAIRYDNSSRRECWITLLFVQVVTFAVSLMVLRAIGIAHVLAIPGSVWLFLFAIERAMRLSSPWRIFVAVACVALTPIGAQLIASSLLPSAQPTNGSGSGASSCRDLETLQRLDALPTTLLFAPLDVSSYLLAFTHHSVVATGHHRNQAGMKTIISAFIAPADQARAIVMATSAQYLAFCKREGETRVYAKPYPHSLMSDLLADHPPTWLRAVPSQSNERISVYRIER
ncbi:MULTISPECIES: hypothetical protein [unclassified Beijerinckia]|uniref:hypothetical protein n=1 Tax=unclassified Beijerinckia TaxID=2638183 RepID=UPI00089562B0|nr:MULTISPECIES: hypothetical protein [unclassified Beijerinckia]MDH7795987.1 hypothetical protein [Beijerinckia sp. GAS462]SEC25184.1 hypothetical protein SAMN05443249_2265 [Beijerinckia sp. 28-YEA-48]